MGPFFQFVRKAALLAAYACVIATGFIFGVPRWQKMNQYQKKHASLLETVELRQEEIRLLKRNQERMGFDKPFVEDVLRGNRRIYPGEIVYFILDAEES